MLAKLVGKCLHFPPEWVDEGSLTSDEWKEFEQHDPPENLPKTQQAVCKLDTNFSPTEYAQAWSGI